MVKLSFSTEGEKKILHDLERFRVNLTQAKPAFEAMSDHVAEAQREQFESQGRRYGGGGWAALSPKYKKWKSRARPGKKILVFDGELKRAAAPASGKGFSFYQVSNKGMEVGLDYNAAPHGEHHQKGEGNLPVRTVVGQPTKEDRKAMTKIIHKHIMGGTGHARS